MSQHIWYLFSVYTVVSITGLYILYENTDGDNGGLDGKAIKGEHLVMIYWNYFYLLLYK